MLADTNDRPRARKTSKEERMCVCQHCAAVFYPCMARIKAGGGKFCGRQCYLWYMKAERERRFRDELKVCVGCGEAKPFSAYNLDAKLLPTSARCKSYFAVYRAELKRKQFPPGQPKPAEQIERERAYTRAYEERHRERRKEMNRQTYLRNKQKVLERSAAWAKAHPEVMAAKMARRRARTSAEDSHTAQDIRDLLAAQRGRCVVCKTDIRSKYHVDHIVPLARGGGNQKTNIQLLCPPCNCSKNAKHPVEFMQERGFLL